MRVNPLVDRALWEHVHLPYMVLPPESRRPRGRPKKKRIRNPNELKKTKRMHKCGRCGNWGHHKSSCKEPLKCIEAQGSQAVPRPPRKLVPRRRTKNKKSRADNHSDVVADTQSRAHVSSQVVWTFKQVLTDVVDSFDGKLEQRGRRGRKTYFKSKKRKNECGRRRWTEAEKEKEKEKRKVECSSRRTEVRSRRRSDRWEGEEREVILLNGGEGYLGSLGAFGTSFD
ncbi:hypothetical protein QJS04_geneDACA012606 [Acorus gramineus]|uniref:CCHC-type domain-containing protein n=1 Tax=Acorus gramineus TaxID=55184 RepID=A0AAV9B1V0_ACOGR|nr:hypothetical protein QJS04_geneDACA012606 [Acorus gramineus]